MINEQDSTQFIVVAGIVTGSILVVVGIVYDQDNAKYRIIND